VRYQTALPTFLKRPYWRQLPRRGVGARNERQAKNLNDMVRCAMSGFVEGGVELWCLHLCAAVSRIYRGRLPGAEYFLAYICCRRGYRICGFCRANCRKKLRERVRPAGAALDRAENLRHARAGLAAQALKTRGTGPQNQRKKYGAGLPAQSGLRGKITDSHAAGYGLYDR
jgi:hypothetical protein